VVKRNGLIASRVRNMRSRFWLEVVLGFATGLMSLLTLAWKDWIEIALRIDPDRHSGLAEWAIVGIFLAITVSSTALVRHEWRRARPQQVMGLDGAAM
jgi:hypothetical protein